MFIIRLVEEDIFAVVSLRSVLLKDTLSTDAVLMTQLLPEFIANFTQIKIIRLLMIQ